MKIDPQASRVTSLFMVLALIVMAALAWSVQRDREQPTDTPATAPPAQPTEPAATD